MDNGRIQLHNIDFDDFIKAIDECKGDVYLETKDGDVLNLKSKLCQMIGLSTILSNSEVAEATIRCTDPEVSSETVSVICEELLLSVGTSDVCVANDPANSNTTANTIVKALLSFNLLRNLDIIFNGAIAAPPSKNNNAPMNPPSDKAYTDIIAKIATPIQRMTFDDFFILNSPINF